MTCVREIHLARSTCLLCRQPPAAGTSIFDLCCNRYSVPHCGDPCGGCSYSPYPSAWFHPACYYILENTYEPSEKPTPEDFQRFAHATKPLYKPEHKERGEIAPVLEGLFSKYTRCITHDIFRQDLFGKLPVEIRVMIAELITPCWYLTVLGESRRLIEVLRNNHGTRSTRISLTRELWMSRIEYQGISYVTGLSNKPLESTDTSNICHIKLPSTISEIILSIDSIGLRGIQFVDHGSNPRPDGSPWYEILKPSNSQLEADVSYDGLFVREIQLTSNHSSAAGTIWTSPFPPKFEPWNFYFIEDKPRLHYLKFDAYIKGLLVCCANSRIVGIHGFSNTSTAFKEFVDTMHRLISRSYTHWIYFPFNGKEYIKAAWVRKFKLCDGLASNPILVLQTSLGRTATFGPQFPNRIMDQYEYIPLVKDGDGPISGNFHDGLNPTRKYATQFGVTCSRRCRAETLELLPMDINYEPPEIPPGRGSIVSTWYMTKAILKGLVKVKVCRNREQLHRPCLGLLLFYSDKHIEALGQVRWEHDIGQEMLTPIYVEKSTVHGRDYIKDIRSELHDRELNVKSGEWQKLPEFGTIVWWFSHFADKIIVYP